MPDIESTPGDAADRFSGHEEYRRWLRVVGACFSPLSPCERPLQFGCWSSWTIEGLYQGLKLFSIRDARLIHPSVRLETLAAGEVSAIHVPEIMGVRTNLIRHDLFRLLKSGRKYNSRRNRTFGLLADRERNWAWTETWRHPVLDIAVDRQRFRTDVIIPAWHMVLLQHEAEVLRLRNLWAGGQAPISNDMRCAHPHLDQVEAFVPGQGSKTPGPLMSHAASRNPI